MIKVQLRKLVYVVIEMFCFFFVVEHLVEWPLLLAFYLFEAEREQVKTMQL